jgi:hypothetical protein
MVTTLSQKVVTAGAVKAAQREGAICAGPQLKVAQKRITLKYTYRYNCQQTSRMQDLAISGNWDFKIFPGRMPRIPIIIMLEDGITIGNNSIFALGPQISLGDPGRCAVHVDLGSFYTSIV